MKKITILSSFALASALIFTGCTKDEENLALAGAGVAAVAAVAVAANSNTNNNNNNTPRYTNDDLIAAGYTCKNYVVADLPMAAYSVSKGYANNNGDITVPVTIDWENPRVYERGECTVRNAKVTNYRVIR